MAELAAGRDALCAGGDICDKPIIAAVNGICLGGRVRELGLVAEVAPERETLPAAKKLAGRVLRCAPLAIRATSQCVLGGLSHAGVPAASQSQEEAAFPALQAMMLSEDIREGLNAFPEKRKLEYKRR